MMPSFANSAGWKDRAELDGEERAVHLRADARQPGSASSPIEAAIV